MEQANLYLNLCNLVENRGSPPGRHRATCSHFDGMRSCTGQPWAALRQL